MDVQLGILEARCRQVRVTNEIFLFEATVERRRAGDEETEEDWR
jgi:hypothetical protein